MLLCCESDGEGRKKDWNEEFLHASEGKESLLALSRIKTRRMGSLCDWLLSIPRATKFYARVNSGRRVQAFTGTKGTPETEMPQ